jgi:hypothetical protein
MRAQTVVVLLFLSGCGGGGAPAAAPTAAIVPTPVATPTPKPLPTPPRAECAPWPVSMAELFAKLPLPDGLCLIRVPEFRGEYEPWSRTIYLGPVFPGDPNPEVAEKTGLAHELCHAHQDWAIVQAGLPPMGPDDRNGPRYVLQYLLSTREGQEYMSVTGYRFLGLGGACTNESVPACYSVEVSKCEGYCNSTTPRMNPYEDNADFCSLWYARDRETLAQFYPRRVAWAKVWLP